MARTSTKKTEEKAQTAPVSEPVEDKTAETAQEAQEAVSGAESGEDKLTISRAELNALIASAVDEAIRKTSVTSVGEASIRLEPPVRSDNMVVLVFFGGIIPGSTVALGELGNIYRDGGTLTVSKENFFSKLNGTAEYMLRTRQLIVVSGLTDEERERYGVLYNEKELLNEKTYGRLLTYTPEELKTIYTALCPEHKAIAAKAFRTAIDNQDGRVTEAKLKLLAKADKEAGIKDSTFKAMLAMFTPETEE